MTEDFCIITFHSLEDRNRKDTVFEKMKTHVPARKNFRCACAEMFQKGKVITRKPILPSEEELEENKRAKSAKLRVFERHKTVK